MFLHMSHKNKLDRDSARALAIDNDTEGNLEHNLKN